MIKQIILYTYVILASGMLFANIYNSLVDAKIWGADIPYSIEAARNYFKQTTPKNFYQIVGTALHVIGLIALIFLWKSAPATRWYLGAAFVVFILVDVMTVTYFFPRNDIMFSNSPMTNVETIKQAWQEWSNMNWGRSFITLIGVFLTCIALHKTYK